MVYFVWPGGGQRLHTREKSSDLLPARTKPVKSALGFHTAIPVPNDGQCDQILITISATVSTKLVLKNPLFYRVCGRTKKRRNRPYDAQIYCPYPNTLLVKRTPRGIQDPLMTTIFSQNTRFWADYPLYSVVAISIPYYIQRFRFCDLRILIYKRSVKHVFVWCAVWCGRVVWQAVCWVAHRIGLG